MQKNVDPKIVSGRVVKTGITSPNSVWKSISHPSDRPIQFHVTGTLEQPRLELSKDQAWITELLDLLTSEAAPIGPVAISGFALYYVCEGARGLCLYRRQDFEAAVELVTGH